MSILISGWADVVSKAKKESRSKEVTVRKIIHEQKKEVVVLNTLDFLYGHVLLKLYNYQYYLRKDVGLVVIIPRAFEWLAPAEASEIWWWSIYLLASSPANIRR
ncbi:MAG: hypothetical protein WDO15_20475 [Bacteroidota bacterium]